LIIDKELFVIGPKQTFEKAGAHEHVDPSTLLQINSALVGLVILGGMVSYGTKVRV